MRLTVRMQAPLAFLVWTAVCWTLDDAGTYAQHAGLYTNDIEEANITIPKKVTPDGIHISNNVTHYHDDNITDHNLVHFNIDMHGKSYLLAVRPALQDFISPNLVIERHRKDNRTRKRISRSTMHNGIKCHYRGIVKGQEKSSVAISACDGLVGVIRDENGEFWVEPMHRHTETTDIGHKHLVFRRSAVKPKTSNKKQRKKKKRHNLKNCGTREPKQRTETRLEWQKYAGIVHVQGRRRGRAFHKRKGKKFREKGRHSKRRRQRSVSLPRCVETLLVADTSMMEFHRDGDVETYLLTIMNMVSSVYAEPSIGNLVKVVVVRIILLEEPPTDPNLEVVVNADTTLRNFCKWQQILNEGDDSHPNHHDTAILVTRKDICARQNTPCGTLGVAHVAGMCQPDRSCSVNEDNGISLSHTIAHELGHNFGMYHDTEKSGCHKHSEGTMHVMTPSFEADKIVVTWSQCSRRDITNFFDQGLGKCLDDLPPEEEKYPYPDLPAGAMYNAEHQCHLQFSRDAQMCSAPDEICSHLWCEIDGVCTSVLKPAAPGTHCGKHMWCQNQHCVPITEKFPAIDGDWGNWSDWSDCSRSCGAGVSIQERKCDHPEPSSGGKYCVGERRRYRMCNTFPCPEGEPSFRAVQCSSYNNQTFHGKKYVWLPYFEQAEPCELYCTDEDDTVIVPWGDYALDGTPCNVGTRNICISGICRKVGCDWIVDSDAKEDRCGVCQGEGKQCNSVKGTYTKQSAGSGYKEVVVIPAGSRNVKIEEMDHSKNYLGIGNAKTHTFYLNGNWQITIAGEYKVGGTEALYERDNELEKVKIPGPLKDDILVYMISRGKSRNPGIRFEYTVARRTEHTSVWYEWILTEWSACSATCGGGMQQRTPHCVHSRTGETAQTSEDACAEDERPAIDIRACGTEACPTHWWVGPWQSCPVTCSRKGQVVHQRRSVMCVDGRQMALPDKHCDMNYKPREREPCRKLPICSEER